jgi:hypothetical protein
MTDPAPWPTLIEPDAPPERAILPARQRLDWASVAMLGAAHTTRASRRSPSQVTSYERCGVAYALSGAGLERPQWANVGGTALHNAIERLERSYFHAPADAVWWTELIDHSPAAVASTWEASLDAEIVRVMDERGKTWPVSTWRASARGKEGYDWWRVEGALMLGRYLTARFERFGRERVWSSQNGPALEWECTWMPAPDMPMLVRLDQIWPPTLGRHDGAFMIVDIKSGARPTPDLYQPLAYALALVDDTGTLPVRAETFNARAGEYAHALTLATKEQVERARAAVVTRAQIMHNGDLHGHYTPHIDAFCGGCGVADLCPVGPGWWTDGQ